MQPHADYQELRAQIVFALITERFGGQKKAFAEAVDIDPTTVSRWFMKGKGRKNIGEDNARKIETKLELPAGSLLAPDQSHKSRPAAESTQPDVFTSQERDLILLFRKIGKRDRQQALAYLKGLADASSKTGSSPFTPKPVAAGEKKRGVS